MQENNRNLSSIIGTIQDEGPSTAAFGNVTDSSGEEGAVYNSVKADVFILPGTDQRRPSWRFLLYIMLIALVISAIFIFSMGDREVDLSDQSEMEEQGEWLQAAIENKQEQSISNQAIHERQSLILIQLEQLSAAIDTIKSGNEKYRADSREGLRIIQKDYQDSINTLAADITELQVMPDMHENDAMPTSIAEENITQVHETSIMNETQVKDDASTRLQEESSDNSPVQTELYTESAAGDWVVNVVSAGQAEPVRQLLLKLQTSGIQAEIQEADVKGKTRYRLRVTGFTSRDEARKYAVNFDGTFGLKDPWVSRR